MAEAEEEFLGENRWEIRGEWYMKFRRWENAGDFVGKILEWR